MSLRTDGTRPLGPRPPEDEENITSEPVIDTSEPTTSDERVVPRFDASGGVNDLLAEIERRGTAAENRNLRLTPRLTTDAQPWRVIFEAETQGRKILGVDVRDVAVVGRTDPNVSGSPELDLASFGAQSMGVSRRHAILLPGEDGLNVIDLDSTNGSWINGVFLQPGQKYPLRAGDRVEFGRLKLVVRVVGEMLQSHGDKSSTDITRPKPRRK